MKKYIDKLIGNSCPENKGYKYVLTTEVFIPFVRMTLDIVKRKEIGLQLIEETILKLLQYNVSTVQDISRILGLDSEIVEYVIGELHVKELINVLSGSISLSENGKNALKRISTIVNETGELEDIYLNLITGEILEKLDRTTSRVPAKDKILNEIIDINLDIVRSKFDQISNIFRVRQEEEKKYSRNLVNNELISIEEIKEMSLTYLPLKIHIYKSESGREVDFVPSKLDRRYFSEIREVLKKQIVERKVFSHIFKDIRYMKEYEFKPEQIDLYIKNQKLMKELLYKYTISNDEDRLEIEEEISKLLLSKRILENNEKELILEYLFQRSNKIDIYALNIRDILFDDFTIQLLALSAKSGKTICINYIYDKQVLDLIKKRKQSLPDLNRVNFIQKGDLTETKFVFNNRHVIQESCSNLPVLENKYIISRSYYIS